ncbi:MAG: phage terminase small subunit P27 family [Ruminococcus sp.]|nr:phage terminase small subunit P27 family [Ruminococcus sp.]
MPNQRQPIQLIQAKGRKHLTKDEIEHRHNTEIQPQTEGIKPPSYLSKEQKKRFRTVAKDLQALEIMGKTDCDALARYVVVESIFEEASKELQKPEVIADPQLYFSAVMALEKAFKMCRAAANDLGLSISSRCKLVVPKAPEKKTENKFSRFDRTG